MTASATSERTAGKPRRALRRLGKLALPIILVALALVLVRRFVGDVYLVREQSMSPGLRGGHDRLFVLHRPDVPGEDDRFGIWIYKSEQVGPDPARSRLRVKRIVGLSGEVLDFQAGDIYVGADRASLRRVDRSQSLIESMLIPIYSSRKARVEGAFNISVGSLAQAEDGSLTLTADEGGLGFRANFIGRKFDRSEAIRDDALDARGHMVAGARVVADIRLDFLVTEIGEDSHLRVRHDLQEEWCEIRVTGNRCEVAADTPDSPAHVLKELDGITLPFRVRMETIDGQFRVLTGSSDDDLTELYSASRDTRRHGGHSGVTLELDRGRAGLAFLDMGRDVHYFWPPTLNEAHKIRVGSVFLVGDNPTSSRDSREEDDVPHEALIGRAVAIVWPPARWKFLRE